MMMSSQQNPTEKTIQDLQKDIKKIKNSLNIIKKAAATQTTQKMQIYVNVAVINASEM